MRFIWFLFLFIAKKIFLKKNLWCLEINSNTSSDWMGFSLMCQQTTRNVVDVLVHISQSKGKISLNMRDSNSRSISRITLPSIVPSVGGFTVHGNLNSTWSNKTLVEIENFLKQFFFDTIGYYVPWLTFWNNLNLKPILNRKSDKKW